LHLLPLFHSLAIGWPSHCARLNIVPRDAIDKSAEVSLLNCLASSPASLMAALAGTVLLEQNLVDCKSKDILSIRAIAAMAISCCRPL